MKITTANLDALRVGFKTSFQGGLGRATSYYTSVATIVPSDSSEERYGWLGQLPNVREWVGDRLVQNLLEHDYAVKNKDWELTIGVDRNHIKDDKLKIYGPMFEEMGASTGAHADMLVFQLLKDGFTSLCYDGQYFFDTDHPVLDKDSKAVSVANTDGGAGQPWFLMCTSRVLKPIIYQLRQDWDFVAKDNPNDENVFTKKKFLYGADARANVGFGFWQMAWGSKQALDAAHYETGRVALTSMKGDFGRPLGLMPNLLVVGPSNEGAARELLNSAQINGSDNKWRGTAELLVVPWLA